MSQESNELHQEFLDAVVKMKFKNTNFPMPVFYSAYCGIRFEIGGNEDVYLPDANRLNPAYINNALIRAKTLYDSLPYAPNLLRIDIYPNEETNCPNTTLQTITQMGFPSPDETVKEMIHNEDDSYLQEHLYWNMSKCVLPVNTLFREIIKADFGGMRALTSNIYFINTEQYIMYHLYDDRGADIVSADKEDLFSLYQKYNGWILEYDREQIDCMFR